MTLSSPIPVRYTLLDGPCAGRTVPMLPSEMAEIEVETPAGWVVYELVPGRCAYRFVK